jgi:hypothetical protein
MLSSSEGTLAKCLPTVGSVEDGVAVYRKFYPAASERKHGVVMLFHQAGSRRGGPEPQRIAPDRRLQQDARLSLGPDGLQQHLLELGNL